MPCIVRVLDTPFLAVSILIILSSHIPNCISTAKTISTVLQFAGWLSEAKLQGALCG